MIETRQERETQLFWWLKREYGYADSKLVNRLLREVPSCDAEASFKAGIREVVEWIEEHSSPEASYTDDLHMTRTWLELPRGLWQAKLKEWGMK